MNIPTTKSISLFSRSVRLIGAMLIFALMIPDAAFSQPYTNPAIVDLGTAGNYRVLAGTALSIGVGCTVTGNVGGTSVTNGGTVTGTTDIANSAVTTALGDLTTAINNLTARTSNATFADVELAGKTLGRGVYAGPGTFGINGILTLDGSSSDIFIFKMTTTLTTGGTCSINLTGGALASNVFWQVGSAATIDGDFKGNILAGTYITQNTGTIDGEVLGKTAVTLNGTSALPVELTTFTAALNNNTVKLNWNTATEVNNYGFDVERTSPLVKGLDGTSTSLSASWKTLGFVQGHGNSNSPKDYSFSDTPLGGTIFNYRLKQIDIDGTFKYSNEIEVSLNTPSQLTLIQNYPNPFNPSTNIEYSIPNAGMVTLRIYDLLGREISTLVNEEKQPGNYQVRFDGGKLSSGVYIYKLQFNNSAINKKMLVIK